MAEDAGNDDTDDISRVPPAAVRRQLRQEVAFGCPVPGCGSPYLEYHHFDPPWAQRHHHDPAGMIALCAEHHAKADAFLVEQLRAMKEAAKNNRDVEGRFDWLRRKLLAFMGGCGCYNEDVLLAANGVRWVWINRDEHGHALLNFWMCGPDGGERLLMIDNDWIVLEPPLDIECPPNGKRLKVRYADGEWLEIRFEEMRKVKEPYKETVDDLIQRGAVPTDATCVFVTGKMLGLDLRPNETVFPNGTTMSGCFSQRSAGAGFSVQLRAYDAEWWQESAELYGCVTSGGGFLVR